jgi:hypothetical protein
MVALQPPPCTKERIKSKGEKKMKVLIFCFHLATFVTLGAFAFQWEQLPNANTPPPGRELPGAGVLNNINLYFFGGMQHCAVNTTSCSGASNCTNVFYNELDVYNLNTNSWTLNVDVGVTPKPSPRFAFAYATDIYLNIFYIYGGSTFQGGSTSSCDVHIFGDLWALTTYPTLKWTRVDENSTLTPGNRTDASIVVVQNNILLFGGLTSSFQLKNDIWKFDTATRQWSLVNNGLVAPVPSPRYHQKMVLDTPGNRLIVVWGDNYPFPQPPINDVWQYFIANNSWALLEPGSKKSLLHPIAGYYNKNLYVANGDLRPRPYEVEFEEGGAGIVADVDPECFDEVTGFESFPVDIHYRLKSNSKGYTQFDEVYPSITDGPMKMSAFSQPNWGKSLYVIGGFNYYCNKFSTTGITRYLTNVYKVPLDDLY